MTNYKTNQKSLRMTDEVMAYIQAAPGDSFNEKFANIILEAKKTLPERQEKVAYYDELIQKRIQQLSKIQAKVESLDITIQAVFSLQDEVHRIQKQIEDILNDS